MVEEEKGLVERERDNLREMAEQAEELAKIIKSLVTGESEGEADTTNEEEEDTNGEEDATNEKLSHNEAVIERLQCELEPIRLNYS